MNFTKMEGLGNDFIITHEIADGMVQSVAKHASWLCDRRRGIGADGVMFVLPSRRADFRMRIFNSDASEAEMCGNGIRCFALYVKALGLTNFKRLTIETLAGEIITELISDKLVKVNMGTPILDASRIPLAQGEGRVAMQELAIDDKIFKFTAVSMGNPHTVIYTEEISDELVHIYGKKIETHPLFPKKTNVEFIKVISEKEIAMRVWERGCGETQACGTGACASAVSGILNKLHGKDVAVHLPGGDLQIQWSGSETDAVYMTGPAEKVFEGNIEIGL